MYDLSKIILLDLLRDWNVEAKCMGVGELIRSDIKRYDGRASEAVTRLGFYAAFFYRLSRYFSQKGALFRARWLQFISHALTGAEISHRAEIGPGLAILHPTAVHIGSGVRIGKTATICQSCTITRMYLYDKDLVIGDFFWGGPGSVIMGQLTIGDYVWVGPNSTLFKDVPSNMKVLGNPARIFPSEAFKKMI